MTLPPPKEFLWQYVYSTPLAAALTPGDDDQWASIEREVAAGWKPFTSDGGLIIEPRVVMVTGSKR